MKNDLRASISTFIKLKEIFMTRKPSKEDIDRYCILAKDWISHKKNKLPFMSDTNMNHMVAIHIPIALKAKGNIFNYSTEGFEANNKIGAV